MEIKKFRDGVVHLRTILEKMEKQKSPKYQKQKSVERIRNERNR